MNILFLCTKFSLSEENGWLTNDLADAFAKQGHSVYVVCVDWSGKINGQSFIFNTSTGVSVVSLPPRAIKNIGIKFEKLTKWLFSSLAARKIIKQKFQDTKFDLVIGFSPAVTMMMPLLLSLQKPDMKSYLILWDFFPYHHQQIGLLKNKFVIYFAKKVEEYLVQKFDYIGCMTKKNIDYLRSHYNIKSSQKITITPLWGGSSSPNRVDKLLVREEFGLPRNSNIAVFGGQLTVGRGIENILAVAKLAQQQQDDVTFLFIGSGPYEEFIREKIANGASNVILLKQVSRNRYLELLSACDIALVCTVNNVDVPTFPSKTIDYFKASLPIVASVEKSSDYGDWIESRNSGLCSEAGDSIAFYENIKKYILDPKARAIAGKNGNDCFNREMDVSAVCLNLLKYLKY